MQSFIITLHPTRLSVRPGCRDRTPRPTLGHFQNSRQPRDVRLNKCQRFLFFLNSRPQSWVCHRQYINLKPSEHVQLWKGRSCYLSRNRNCAHGVHTLAPNVAGRGGLGVARRGVAWRGVEAGSVTTGVRPVQSWLPGGPGTPAACVVRCGAVWCGALRCGPGAGLTGLPLPN